MSVNVSAIKAAINGYVNSPAFKSANKAAISEVTREKAEEATQLLADCINRAIASSGMSGGAVAAVGTAVSGGVTPVGDGSSYRGTVLLPGQSRPSLYPEKYGAVIDMALLLNNGYSARDKVFGIWHGEPVKSLQFRTGAHFVPNGVREFNAGYGAAYNAHAEVSGGFE